MKSIASILEFLSNIFDNTDEPTGFDRHSSKKHLLGVMELCGASGSGIYWRIDENGLGTTHTGQTTFGDGITPLGDRTFVHYPVPGQPHFSFWNRGKEFLKTGTEVIQVFNSAAKQIIAYDKDGIISQADSVEEAINAVVMGIKN